MWRVSNQTPQWSATITEIKDDDLFFLVLLLSDKEGRPDQTRGDETRGLETPSVTGSPRAQQRDAEVEIAVAETLNRGEKSRFRGRGQTWSRREGSSSTKNDEV